MATIAAAAMIALTVSLGRWQMHRAEEMEARQSLLEARLREPPVRLTGAMDSAEPLLFRRVQAAGEWIAPGQIYIDNQVHEGEAGFRVITPLRLHGGSGVVLVDRGWIRRTRDYPRAPAVPVPAGPADVIGTAVVPPARFLELSSDTVAGNVWQNLTIERYRARTNLPVLPIVVLADTPAPGLVAVHDRDHPAIGVEMHREYEFTWFLLAATAFVLWVVVNMRRVR